MPSQKTVTAVLGPTNTGKTHLAVERMLGHGSGMIGLPLRLLAREIYDKVRARVGDAAVALVTGEEKIIPVHARYWICTVEAMPSDVEVPFLAIDEVQLCADFERGHIFTDRVMNRRGRDETMLLGAGTMRPILEKLLPGTTFVSRPRFSQLLYAGQKKLTRLPRRSAIVAFSADMVYATAELIRRQRGGAAVVLGALSPRTRNAQVALYQSGDVDYIVATDAVGMGLNMDVDHVAFASTRKFDGFQYRQLNPSELGQVAGRAGRYMNDGTFGVTADCEAFEDELEQRVESHRYDPVRVLQWRNADLDFRSLASLNQSLDAPPPEKGLTRARPAIDAVALRLLSDDDAPHRDAIATIEKISRTALDELAVESQKRAAVAIAEGRFDRSLVSVLKDDGSLALDREEFPRPGTTLEGLAKLAPSFAAMADMPLDAEGTTLRSLVLARYPGLNIEHVHHAGNSSGVVDGAAAILLANPDYAKSQGWKPRARVVAMANMGDDPTLMLNAPVPAARKVLAKAGLTLDDIDLFEVNEAFAVVAEKFIRDTGVDRAKVNVNGGAMALGHPIGATGALLIGTIVDELERRGGRYGLVTMCAAGGMAPAIIIERL